MKISNLNELFVHELKDLYDAESQLIEALPKMADAAISPELKLAFQSHLGETRDHVARLEEIFRSLSQDPERKTCKAMKGLITEGKRMMKESDTEVMDAGLISAAQRVEHYEIAAYGTLIAWARTAGMLDLIPRLETTLSEERAADETLTGIALSGINAAAA